MAKTKTKKVAVKKKSAPRVKKSEVTTPENDLFDFSTAREIDNPKMKNTSPAIASFYVTDIDGNEVVFHCAKGFIPEEAKAALGW